MSTFTGLGLILQHSLFNHVVQEEDYRRPGHLQLIIPRIMNVLVRARLVEEGIFLTHGEVFRESLRRTFRAYGMEPFYIPGEIEGDDEEMPEDVATS
jgi:hypothetical protein